MSQNTINVNYMTRTYTNFIKSQEARHRQPSISNIADIFGNSGSQNASKPVSDNSQQASFQGKLAGTAEKGILEASLRGDIPREDMTMEEYKQYIYDEISNIPMHPSRMQDNFSIHISEEGFEAMKNDPEYEAWVLQDIRRGFQQENALAGICGGSFCISYYGATKEECHAQMWSKGYNNGKGESLYKLKSEKSFWEKRREKKRKLKKLQDEMRMHEVLEKRRIQKACADNIMIARKDNEDMTQSEAMAKAMDQVAPIYNTHLMMALLNGSLGV